MYPPINRVQLNPSEFGYMAKFYDLTPAEARERLRSTPAGVAPSAPRKASKRKDRTAAATTKATKRKRLAANPNANADRAAILWERRRIAAILDAPEAKHRQKSALVLAAKTDLTSAEARKRRKSTAAEFNAYGEPRGATPGDPEVKAMASCVPQPDDAVPQLQDGRENRQAGPDGSGRNEGQGNPQLPGRDAPRELAGAAAQGRVAPARSHRRRCELAAGAVTEAGPA